METTQVRIKELKQIVTDLALLDVTQGYKLTSCGYKSLDEPGGNDLVWGKKKKQKQKATAPKAFQNTFICIALLKGQLLKI